MAEAVIVPKLGLTMKKATVVKWNKREGEAVRKGEIIAEIETDKVTCQIESPTDGMLLKILGQKGAIVPVGGAIAYVGQQGEKIPEIVMTPQTSPLQSVSSITASGPTVIASRRPLRKSESLPEQRDWSKKSRLMYPELSGQDPKE